MRKEIRDKEGIIHPKCGREEHYGKSYKEKDTHRTISSKQSGNLVESYNSIIRLFLAGFKSKFQKRKNNRIHCSHNKTTKSKLV